MVNDHTRKKKKGCGTERIMGVVTRRKVASTLGDSNYMYNTCIICLLKFNEASKFPKQMGY
jgi:hypothetical protein